MRNSPAVTRAPGGRLLGHCNGKASQFSNALTLASHPPPPPPMRPDLMSPTTRRPRQVDTSRHFCPRATCDYRGWLGLGNLRANGHPNGGPRRQFHCTACDAYFPEHHGTIFHGKRVSVDLIVRVIACLAEGLGVRGMARVFEIDPNTVLSWLV